VAPGWTPQRRRQRCSARSGHCLPDSAPLSPLPSSFPLSFSSLVVVRGQIPKAAADREMRMGFDLKGRPARVCGVGGRRRSPASVPRGTRRASGERRQAQGRGFPPRVVCVTRPCRRRKKTEMSG
jgi:hypothetical protein